MAFTSIPFFVFLLAVLITEPIFRGKRHLYLATVSIIYYSLSGFELVILLIISSFFDHISVKKFNDEKGRIWLIFAISLNIIFLVCVKLYYYLELKIYSLEDLVPLGISFYTLQSVSYLIDVYNKKVKRIEIFTDYLAYISYFPQLVAGPIERCKKLYPQLEYFGLTDDVRATKALRLFVFGLYLKLVVSNRLAGPIIEVASTNEYDLFYFLNGILVYVYVYADFFSYTLMARGLSAVFGVDLSMNFDRPFRRKNLISFWQSWHISLTRWAIDYFYIPILTRINSTRFNKILFSMITMVLVGLWHGFGWNFVIFGFINGAAMQLFPLIDKATDSISFKFPKLNNRFGIALVMAISGNLFLSGSSEGILMLVQQENYMYFSVNNALAYMSTSFLLGILGAIPLLVHELTRVSYLYRDIQLKKELAIIFMFLILIFLFHAVGSSHVYFAF